MSPQRNKREIYTKSNKIDQGTSKWDDISTHLTCLFLFKCDRYTVHTFIFLPCFAIISKECSIKIEQNGIQL